MLLGISEEEIQVLRDELSVERTLRARGEAELLKAHSNWAHANEERYRLRARVTELQARVARCKCRVN
jgi:chromosome segregation ATPase